MSLSKNQNQNQVILKDALQQMQQLLGKMLIEEPQDHESLDQEQDQFNLNGQERKEINLDQYVQILNNKYNKVLKILEQEENSTQKRKEENEKLKSVLSSTLSQNVKMLFLQNNNSERISIENKPVNNGGILQKQIEDKKIQNQQIEEQLKLKQEELQYYVQQNEQLNSRVESLQNILLEIDVQQKNNNDNFDEVNLQFQMKFDQLMASQHQLNQQIQKLRQQETQAYKLQQFQKNLDQEHDKVKQEIQVGLNKIEVQIQKLMSLTGLKEKMSEELIKKNEELQLFRENNQQLEEKCIQLSNIEIQLQMQQDSKRKLLGQRQSFEEEFKRIEQHKHINQRLEVLVNCQPPSLQQQIFLSQQKQSIVSNQSSQLSEQTLNPNNNNNNSQTQSKSGMKSEAKSYQQQDFSQLGYKQQQQQGNSSNIINKAKNQMQEKDQVIEIQKIAFEQMKDLKQKFQQEMNQNEKQKHDIIQNIHLLEYEMEELAVKFDELDQSLSIVNKFG